MMNFGVGGIALLLLGLAILMFVLAWPRHGEVVPFLQGKDNLQSFYVIGLMTAMIFGIVLVVFSLTR